MTKIVPNTTTPVITVAKKRGRKSKNEIALAPDATALTLGIRHISKRTNWN